MRLDRGRGRPCVVMSFDHHAAAASSAAMAAAGLQEVLSCRQTGWCVWIRGVATGPLLEQAARCGSGGAADEGSGAAGAGGAAPAGMGFVEVRPAEPGVAGADAVSWSAQASAVDIRHPAVRRG
jgi:hypothetical protein